MWIMNEIGTRFHAEIVTINYAEVYAVVFLVGLLCEFFLFFFFKISSRDFLQVFFSKISARVAIGICGKIPQNILAAIPEFLL